MKGLDGVTLYRNWTFLGLEEAISTLDNRCFPLPSIDDLSCILHKCIKEKRRSSTLHLHAHLQKHGLDTHTTVGNSLILALVGVGCMNAAQNVFDSLVHRENRSWNSLIAGYVQCGQPDHALTLYQHMHMHASLHLSGHAFVALLKACTDLKRVIVGCMIHIEIVEKGLLESNLFVASTLVDMYAKCGFLSEARVVFDSIQTRDAVLWTALISGYAEFGCNVEALDCFKQMQLDGFSPDATTFVSCLKACKGAGVVTRGEYIFADVVRKGLEKELIVGNIVIDMYAKCGMLAEALAVFDNHSTHSEVSWNVVMTTYEEAGCYEEALQCFEQMRKEEFVPDNITYVCCLKACGIIGIRDRGQEIHADICRQGLEKEIVVSSALVDMYAKCGTLLEAQDVFKKLQCQDVVSWTALIAGHSQCGQTDKVCSVLDRMIASGIRPNLITFVSLLASCNHSGLLENGELWLDSMCKAYGITPTRKHYSCLIDLFGRAGFFHKAMALIHKMPFHPGIVVWHTMLSACQRWGNVKLGSIAFDHSVQLDENDVGAYISMSNIYANAGMEEDAYKVEAIWSRRLDGQRSRSSWWKEPTKLFSGE